jgi:hypothetical protein
MVQGYYSKLSQLNIIDPKHAYPLFASEIQHAQSEVIIAVNSILNLEYLAETGLSDSLKKVQSNSVSIMLLYTGHDESGRTLQIVANSFYYQRLCSSKMRL